MKSIFQSSRAIRNANYSSISNAFNTKNYADGNRKYARERLTGLFGIHDLKSDSGLEMIRFKAESDCQILLKEALSPMRQRKIVQVLDDISDTVCRVADLAECMRMLHPDPELRGLAAHVCQQMAALVERFNTDQRLFSVLDTVVCTGVDVQPLDSVDRRVASLLHHDFEASGIHLDDAVRDRFVQETQRAQEFASVFHAGTENPVNIPASVLSAEMRNKLGLATDQRIEISHTYAYSADPYIRELGYRGYYSNNGKQEELLRCLLESRHNIARYSEFPSYAERANVSMICESSNNVEVFLNSLSSQLRPLAERDRLAILKAKYGPKVTASDLYRSDYQLMPWDLQFYLNQKKQESLSGGYNSYSPYLSLGACMEGVSQLLNSQFGLRLQVEECIPGELWHPDVFKVAVSHPHMGYVGTVYCDLLARKSKPAADCHYTVRAGRAITDEHGQPCYQSPVVVLHASLTPVAAGESMVLLTPPAVETLFHEWGHALHSLLARTRYQHVAGTRCSTDLAEAPSTLFEMLALDPLVVREFARHHSSGLPLPPDMLIQLGRQRRLGLAIETQLTLAQSMLDQQLHSANLPLSSGKTSGQLMNDVLRSDSLVPGTRVLDSPPHSDQLFWPQRFGHLMNYGARFYSYLLSHCIAAGVLWNRGFCRDPWSSSVGQRYHETILQHGGQYKPIDMLSDFVGGDSKITTDSLVKEFVEDLENNYEK